MPSRCAGRTGTGGECKARAAKPWRNKIYCASHWPPRVRDLKLRQRDRQKENFLLEERRKNIASGVAGTYPITNNWRINRKGRHMSKKIISPTGKHLGVRGKPELHPNEAVGLKVFAVTGALGDPDGPAQDWAVYQGLTTSPDEEVIEYGDKIEEKVAKLLFPGFSHLHYRG